MSKKRKSNKRTSQLDELATALEHNGKAIKEGPKPKSWSILDLETVNPLTPAQEDMFHAWFNGNHLAVHGSAGTGKSFLALYLALNEVLQKNHNRIIIMRSAVSTRDVGFLPGDLNEKIQYYELPYHDILEELIGRRSTYTDMKDANLIEFMTTSFIRGLTWDNAVVVVEEGENMTWHEIDSVMTRIGENTRVIFTGDLVQTDLDGTKKNGSCGMGRFLKTINNMEKFESIEFNHHDIVRSDFVKSWIKASDQVS